MYRKCKYMIFGYFMKVTVLPILPGEAMLVPSVNQFVFWNRPKRVPIDAA